MKIMAATRYDAASYYRLVAPFSLLRYRGVDVEIGAPAISEIDKFDLLWLQMHADAEAELLARIFKERGGKVVYDVDDWLFDLPPSWPAYDHFFERGTGKPTNRLGFHERLIRMADVVTTTTPYLAGKLRELFPSADVRVLPNCVMAGDWDGLGKVSSSLDGPVVGWFGTGNHWDDWMEIAEPVAEAVLEVGGYLALMGAPELTRSLPPKLRERTRVHPLVPVTEFRQVRLLLTASMVGLAYVTDRLESSKCRSPLKALQWGAAGVPLIASESVYGDLDPDSALFSHVHSPNMLYDALVSVLLPPQPQRDHQAQLWQERVLSEHSYETQAHRWYEVANSIT